ncbi:MAG: adenosylcobinamide-phosphate synthase CbiB [Nitrospiraceae bacterium]|nr:adenosylcobinamide-phosphate synthase CbiB [Nitrospiraceae bacterium]
MIGPIELICAFFLDLAIGDPSWLPHPVRVMGKAITSLEGFLRRHCGTPAEERRAGVVLVCLIVPPSFGITLLIHWIIMRLSYNGLILPCMVLLVYLISTTIAVRGLLDAAKLVMESVKDGSVEAARRKLGMIVGRDTETLSTEQVLKATIETVAENLSDGIIAPLFYLTIGGLPAAMAYKAVNTLDSMVGYRDERYRHFGWAAARLDDIANYAPARITGLLIALCVFLLNLYARESLGRAALSLRVMRRDGRKHPSPNSGIPEAAMAGALGVRLGGVSTYGGIEVEKPQIGDIISTDYLTASEGALAVARLSSVVGVAAAATVTALRAWL